MKIGVPAFKRCSIPGLNLAIVVLPQAIAFSFLAGVPPRFGIYCAVYGVLIVALLNPSPRFHGGPNSSMSVAIAVALLPMAPPFGPQYIGYMLSLAVMIGTIQLAIAAIGPLSRLTDFISEAVVAGLIFGIGLFLIFKSITPFGGLPNNTQVEWPLWITWQSIQDVIDYGNPFAIEIGFVTLVSAIVARQFEWLRKWYLIVGLLIGTLYSVWLNHRYGLMATQLEQVGDLDMRLIWPSLPTFSADALPDLLGLLPSALAIALLGIFQTVAIVRQSPPLPGEEVSTRMATFADGVANIAAGFLSAMPGCGSFNRVSVMTDLKVMHRLAAILSAVYLMALIYVAGDLLALIPLPAMAALIMLVGANMLRWDGLRRYMDTWVEALTFFAAFASVHIFGLLNAALIGAALALFNWVWVKIHPHILGEGPRVAIVGDLDYASLRILEREIKPLMASNDWLEIDLRASLQLDAEAARWLKRLSEDEDCHISLRMRKAQQRKYRVLLRVGFPEDRITRMDECGRLGGDVEAEGDGAAPAPSTTPV